MWRRSTSFFAVFLLTLSANGDIIYERFSRIERETAMTTTSTYFILFFSAFVCALNSTAMKVFSNRKPSRAFNSVAVSIFSLFAAATLLVWGGFGKVSTFSVLLGIAFGALIFLNGFFSILAFASGPWSYTFLIISLSMLMPAFSGAFFWHEHISLQQYIGTALVVLCLIMSIEKKEDEKKASLKWFIFTMAAYLTAGSVGITQKIHQSSAYADELNGFLIISFVAGAVLSGISALIFTFKEGFSDHKVTLKELATSFGLFVIIGLANATMHKLNLYLVGVMDAAVFFPVANGVPIILTSLIAFTAFKEKLSKKQWVGLLIGSVAVVLLTVQF